MFLLFLAQNPQHSVGLVYKLRILNGCFDISSGVERCGSSEKGVDDVFPLFWGLIPILFKYPFRLLSVTSLITKVCSRNLLFSISHSVHSVFRVSAPSLHKSNFASLVIPAIFLNLALTSSCIKPCFLFPRYQRMVTKLRLLQLKHCCTWAIDCFIVSSIVILF